MSSRPGATARRLAALVAVGVLTWAAPAQADGTSTTAGTTPVASSSPDAAQAGGGGAAGAASSDQSPYPAPVTGEPGPPPGVQFAPAHPEQVLPALLADQGNDLEALSVAQQAQSHDGGSLSLAVSSQEEATVQLAQLRGRAYQAAVALQQARDRLRTLAVADYVSGGPASEVGVLLQSAGPEELGSRSALVGALSTSIRNAEAHLNAAERQASGAAAVAANTLSAADSAVSTAEAALQADEAQVATQQAAYGNLSAEVSLVGIASPAPGTDIPQIVLEAYERAASSFQGLDPSCGIEWQDIAALGRIESGHAQHADTRLAPNGDTYPPILGPPLDGSAGNAALPQPAGLPYYDGPGPWEQAVGPMQFIPTSWATSGMVGGSDTSPDPNNVFDAAMGAANYLCRAAGGQSLTTVSGLTQAYLSYNHSQSYVSEALGNATSYGATLLP